MFGWCGRLLQIDLTKRTGFEQSLSPEFCRMFIGGRGMAGYFLKGHVTRAWDDYLMPLLLFTGPLVNTA